MAQKKVTYYIIYNKKSKTQLFWILDSEGRYECIDFIIILQFYIVCVFLKIFSACVRDK